MFTLFPVWFGSILTVLGMTNLIGSTTPSSLFIAYPPPNHSTTSDRIFLLGTAPLGGEVFINGQVIERSSGGHFAPSFPLKVGNNVFTFRYKNEELTVKINRQSSPDILSGLGFVPNSLTPAVDLAKLPGELLCLSAIASPNSQMTVQLAGQTIPLTARPLVNLPENKAVLVGDNSPKTSLTQRYEGCVKTPSQLFINPTIQGGLNLGKPVFNLTVNGKTMSEEAGGNIRIISPVELEVVEVIVESGITRSGPSSDYSRLTPLPRGTKATITGKEGEWLRLDYGAWIKASEVKVIKDTVPPKSIIRGVQSRQVRGWTEILFPLEVPVPMAIQQGDKTLTLTLYNTTAQTDIIRLDDDPLIHRLDWQQIAPNQVQYTFNLKTAQPWGYQLRYEGTTLVLSLRHPPQINSQKQEDSQRGKKSLSGVKILLDPGHGGPEDLGGVGPTGEREKNINLILAKLVREGLIAQGATVVMTRETDIDLDLAPRIQRINREEPTLAISLHYNALPDYGNAMKTQGIGAFWYHPQSHSLAVFLHNYLVKKLNRPSYGVYWNNLALTRPSVTPSVLLEFGFMINPEEFEWIINPDEQRKLANAIVQGIGEWLQQTL